MKIVLIGQGGHSKVIRDIILGSDSHQIAGYLDDKFESFTTLDQMYFGPVSSAHQIIREMSEIRFVIAIGNNQVRRLIAERLDIPEEYYLTLIHKTAVISSSAFIGPGTVVMANAVINADAQIGRHVIINTGSVVEHDNRIGDFVHISPNATLTGTVLVEEGTHIGAGATVIPNRRIGEWSVIGAGATVIRDIPPYTTAVGTPARVKIKTIN